MRRFHWLGVVLLTLLAPGCMAPKMMQRVDGCLLTFYTHPARPRPGEMQVAVRVQDRDYRILSGHRGRVRATRLPQGPSQEAMLKPGPGKDLRAWIVLDQAGPHAFDVELFFPDGNSCAARFLAWPRKENREKQKPRGL